MLQEFIYQEEERVVTDEDYRLLEDGDQPFDPRRPNGAALNRLRIRFQGGNVDAPWYPQYRHQDTGWRQTYPEPWAGISVEAMTDDEIDLLFDQLEKSLAASACRGGYVGLVKDVQEAVKAFGEIAVKPLLAVAVGAGFLIFVPTSVLDVLGVVKLVKEFRPWLGIAFTLSCAYLLAHGVIYVWNAFKQWHATRRTQKRRERALLRLTPDEKARLAPYILGRKASVTYAIGDGVVGGLEAKRILYRSSAIGHAISGFPYNLEQWARESLEKNPSLLDGALQQATEPHAWMSR